MYYVYGVHTLNSAFTLKTQEPTGYGGMSYSEPSKCSTCPTPPSHADAAAPYNNGIYIHAVHDLCARPTPPAQNDPNDGFNISCETDVVFR